jgi:hypothetical protein
MELLNLTGNNDNHKLAVIYNFLDASKDKPAHPTAIFVEVQMLLHYNSQIQDTKLTIKYSSFLVELNSKFSEVVTNKLQAGYTHFDDFRNRFLHQLR